MKMKYHIGQWLIDLVTHQPIQMFHDHHESKEICPTFNLMYLAYLE